MAFSAEWSRSVRAIHWLLPAYAPVSTCVAPYLPHGCLAVSVPGARLSGDFAKVPPARPLAWHAHLLARAQRFSLSLTRS